MKNLKVDYDSNSPVTGNFCVMEESDPDTNTTSYMCMESGWTTSDHMKIGSELVQTFEENCTELMRKSRIDDEERGLVWFPVFMQMPNAMLYCAGDNMSSLKWEVATVVNISEDDKEKYPIPGRPGEYYTSKLDIENAKQYDKLDFETALNELYDIVEKGYNEYKDQLRDSSM